jgi:pimeloyl-ACP methyl ester carboxylesterase
LSDKPPGIAAYSIDRLAADAVGLINSADREKAFLVGHDWGAGVAWWVAAKFPERVERLVIINAPHWSVFQTNLRRNPSQMLKSWYFLFFQLPRLPEALWRWSVRGPIAGPPSRAGMFTSADPELYRQAWLQPGALTAMINWYRAAVRGPRPPPATPRIGAPTLLI